MKGSRGGTFQVNSDIARVGFLSVLAQGASFAKSVFIAFFFGIGTDVDGYYLGQVVPAIAVGVLAGFLQSGFLPIYARHVAQSDSSAASALLGRTLAVLFTLGTCISIAIAIFAPWLINQTAQGASPAVQAAAVVSLRALAFTLLLNGLADCLSLALNVHGAFAMAALAPTANGLIGCLILAVLGDWGLQTLIWSTMAGVAVQLALVYWEVARRGIGITLRGQSSLRPVWSAGFAILPGLVFANLSAALPALFAAGLGDGAVATFSIAARLHSAAIQVFAMAASTVLLPHFALMVGRGGYRSIAEQLQRNSWGITVIAVAALLMVGLEGADMVGLLFERGEFDHRATLGVAECWFWLTLGLGPTISSIVLAKALQALRMGVVMSGIALVALLVTYFLGAELSRLGGLVGLAIAVAAAALISAAANSHVLTLRLRRESVRVPHSTPSRYLVLGGTLTAIAMGCDFLLRDVQSVFKVAGLGLCLGIVVWVLATRISPERRGERRGAQNDTARVISR